MPAAAGEVEAGGAGAAAEVERAPGWQRRGALDGLNQLGWADACVPGSQPTAVGQGEEQAIELELAQQIVEKRHGGLACAGVEWEEGGCPGQSTTRGAAYPTRNEPCQATRLVC